MISLPHTNRGGPQRAYLVERYVSPAAAEDLAEATARAAELCAGPDHVDAGVLYLYSAYLPSEDTCFCLFRAPSSDAVRSLNDHADFALDRITDAALLVCLTTEAQLLRRHS